MFSVTGHPTNPTRTLVDDHDYGFLHEQLQSCAAKWELIATGLRFKSSEIRSIKCDPLNITGGPIVCLGAVLAEWMQWSPGDARGSRDRATLEALKKAVSYAGYGVVAEELTLTEYPPDPTPKPLPPSDDPTPSSSSDPHEHQISRWRHEATPESFSSYYGSALFDVDKAYFLRQSKLFLYQPLQDGGHWSELLDTMYEYSGLVMINKKLTTVSGWNNIWFTKSIRTLNESSSKISWDEELPDVPTGRESPACAVVSNHLIVLGGVAHILNFTSSRVEVLDISTLQWSRATNIPANLREP